MSVAGQRVATYYVWPNNVENPIAVRSRAITISGNLPDVARACEGVQGTMAAKNLQLQVYGAGTKPADLQVSFGANDEGEHYVEVQLFPQDASVFAAALAEQVLRTDGHALMFSAAHGSSGGVKKQLPKARAARSDTGAASL